MQKSATGEGDDGSISHETTLCSDTRKRRIGAKRMLSFDFGAARLFSNGNTCTCVLPVCAKTASSVPSNVAERGYKMSRTFIKYSSRELIPHMAHMSNLISRAQHPSESRFTR